VKLDDVIVEDSYDRIELTKLDSVDDDVFIHTVKSRRVLLLFRNVPITKLVGDIKQAAGDELLKQNGHPLHSVGFQKFWYDVEAKTLTATVADSDEPTLKVYVTVGSNAKPKSVEEEPKQGSETVDLLKIWKSLSWKQNPK
jgi:hypothetical protein